MSGIDAANKFVKEKFPNCDIAFLEGWGQTTIY